MQSLDAYSLVMIVVFVVGYLFIVLEHVTKVNKATVAMLTAIVCWFLQFINPAYDFSYKMDSLNHHLASISQIIFFLLGAMTVVETINVHRGFNIISDYIQFKSKRVLLWVVGIVAFFLSAILDNLTTTIVMIVLLQKLIDSGEERLLIGGSVVIAANAGGAWTPIGDVTTTMLWINGQITSLEVIKSLFFPSFICLFAALMYISCFLKGEFAYNKIHFHEKEMEPKGTLIFFLGVGLLIFVPIFKTMTGLPPFMGMLLALSVLWLVTDVVHKNFDERQHLRMPQIFTKVDLSGPLFFFLGILMTVDALDTAHVLDHFSAFLNNTIGNHNLIAAFIGIASAVVDNVPLVAAVMGMYDLTQFPTDHEFWQMIAFCAGTGGSLLIIGSAAGIAFMSMDKVNFFWYFRRIAIPATIGYAAGIASYLLLVR